MLVCGSRLSPKRTLYWQIMWWKFKSDEHKFFWSFWVPFPWSISWAIAFPVRIGNCSDQTRPSITPQFITLKCFCTHIFQHGRASYWFVSTQTPEKGQLKSKYFRISLLATSFIYGSGQFTLLVCFDFFTRVFESHSKNSKLDERNRLEDWMEIELEEIRQKYIQTLIEMRQNFRSNEKSQTFKITSNNKTNNYTEQPMSLSMLLP